MADLICLYQTAAIVWKELPLTTATKAANKPQPKAPLRARIRHDIEQRILSGDWAPGHRIPFEHELMAEYNCARMTVSKVLASLADSGLIERRRRAGSFVRRPQSQSAVLEIPDIKAEVIGRGHSYDYELISARRRRATKDERVASGISKDSTLLALQCRHFADGTPYAVESRQILLDTVPEAGDANFFSEPPGTWLLQHVAWHEAEHHIAAVNADQATAKLLDIAPGAACLVLNRRTWRSGQLLTAVRIWYPGTSQTLVARFTPSMPR